MIETTTVPIVAVILAISSSIKHDETRSISSLFG